jgi:hypothetical protein
MPHYMKSIVSVDRANRCYQVAVLFDDDDLNAIVCQHTFGSMPTGHQYDPDKVTEYVTDAEIDHELARMGFRVVGSGPALEWGERIVRRANSDFTFFDPGTREWYTVDPNGSSE